MLDQFITAAEAVGATVKRFSDTTGLVAHLETLTTGKKVHATALPQPFADTFARRPKVEKAADLDICISFARAGIAATGTVMVDLDDTGDRGATALPLVHAVILRASSIVPSLQALGSTLREALNEPGARYFSLTTGPSRTADIERVLTIGVHGPKEFHILILEEGAA